MADMILVFTNYIMEKFDIRPSQAYEIMRKVQKLISEEVQKIKEDTD